MVDLFCFDPKMVAWLVPGDTIYLDPSMPLM